MAPQQSAPITYTYRIHQVPTSDPSLLYFFAGKNATLRLSALQTSGSAFGSTFVRESAWTPAESVARLQRDKFHTFIAVAYPSETPLSEQTLETGDWIGCGTVIGPTPLEIFDLPESGGPTLGSDDEEDKYHMTFVYNEPLHRGKGVTKMLIQAVLDFTEGGAGAQGRGACMRIFIHPDNILVKKLYEACGFEDAGMCTYAEAVLANGEADLLPADGGFSDVAKYHLRGGLTMMRRSKVKTNGA